VGLLFFPATPWAHRALVWTLSLATTLLIAASRNHYTVDILMALFLTPLMLNFWITHPGALALGVLRPEDYPWAPPSRILGMPVVEEVPREEPKPAEQPGPSPPLSPLSSASAASSAGPPAPPAATTDSAEGEGVPPDAPQGSALGGHGLGGPEGLPPPPPPLFQFTILHSYLFYYTTYLFFLATLKS
jgi:hypothetical protein